MKTALFISGSVMRVAAVLLAGTVAAGVAHARSNPTDPVSNPEKLDYSDVNMTIPKYDEPFQRDGVVTRPETFKQITAGMKDSAVQALIGSPLNQTNGSQGVEWNYNFKFLMANSQNYLVCQYKVVFDAEQQVKEAVWRRHQCLDIVAKAGS